MACERIGILGGTFDPPHNGHLALARGVAAALGLGRVLLMPTGRPNFKQGLPVTPAPQRVEMLRLAASSDPTLALDLREVVRPGVTYTVDTLEELRAEAPDAELFFVVGADSAATLPTWRGAARLAQLATFVAVQRPGYDFTRIKERVAACGLGFAMRYLELETPDVSSTQVRELAAAGEGLEGLVPPSVAAYIREQHVYG